jgi:hypothetical protein
MKVWLLSIACILIGNIGWSQITITAADMPVHGDTLRYTNAMAFGTTLSAADSGESMTWTYDFTGTSQGLDDFQKPAEVNPLYSFTLPANCYGYKIADSIPGIGLIASGITINNLYTFFNEYIGPDAYSAEAFGAQISGFPVGASYILPDVWFMFPLNYNNNDSNDFHLKFGLATVGQIIEKGYRKSRVDGWGTITTPYFTTPTNCIRVRQEIHEIDSIAIDTISFGIPRVSVEYKYLVNGEHYPAVWATGSIIGGFELITGVKYRDVYRPELNPPPNTDAVTGIADHKTEVTAYPNPIVNSTTTLNVPASWTQYFVDVYDMHSRAVASYKNTSTIKLADLPSGNYLVRVMSGANIAFLKITK